MQRFIDAKKLEKKKKYCFQVKSGAFPKNDWFIKLSDVLNAPTEDVFKITRCTNCRFHNWEQDTCHGKTEHFCSVLKTRVFADFFCYHGKPKEDKE